MTQGQRIISGSVQDDDHEHRQQSAASQAARLHRSGIAEVEPRHRDQGSDDSVTSLSITVCSMDLRVWGRRRWRTSLVSRLEVRVRTSSGPAIERPGDMVAILTQLQENDILFIDEVHRLSRVVEEVLYPAMEDRFVSWVIDKGLKARSMNLTIRPFTLVGATTRFGMVSAPLRDRFGQVHRLDFYDEGAMRTIVERSARIMEIEADDDGISEIARRSRGTPRVANRLLRRVRDYAQVVADNVITTGGSSGSVEQAPGG